MQRNLVLRWLVVLAVPAMILVLPRPAGLEPNAWYILALFAATMAGLIAQPLPGGAMVFLALVVLAVSGLVPIAKALAGYGDPVVWLVLAAFFISRGMIKT